MMRFVPVIIALAALTLVLLPFQLIGLAFGLSWQRRVPRLYHRLLCAIVGVRIRQVGRITGETPVLILANHASWLDICVISALTPVVFVAKSEVAGWPLFGWLARLQRTVFIDRERRHRTGDATEQIAGRLLDGNAVVLFAEGTSGDGTRILPFKSALVGSVHHALGVSTRHDKITVQPMSPAASSVTLMRFLPATAKSCESFSLLRVRVFRTRTALSAASSSSAPPVSARRSCAKRSPNFSSTTTAP